MFKAIGGKLIDTGGYSCVFHPALQCKTDGTKIQGRAISKLMQKDYAEIEWHISERVRKIPLWKHYFSVSERICELSNIQTDKDITTKCDLVRKHSIHNLRLLQMAYIGKSISAYSFPSTFNMMHFVIHILEAGALLLVNNIIHFDIHDGNILINNHSVPKLIDFNLSFIAHEVTESDLFHDYTSNIHLPQLTPDYMAILAILHNIPMDRIIYNGVRSKHLKCMMSVLGISQHKVTMDLTKITQSANGDLMNWFNRCWTKIDSWAIAMYLVDMIRRYSLVPQIGSVFKTHPVLKKVLSHLCTINPNERWDCMRALSILHPNSIIIKRYGTEWLKDHPIVSS